MPRSPIPAAVCALVVAALAPAWVAQASAASKAVIFATGNFGEGRNLLALDAHGRIVEAFTGPQDFAVAMCPGARRFGYGAGELTVRSTKTLRVTGRPPALGSSADELRCLDRKGTDFVSAAEYAGADQSRPGLLRVHRGRVDVLLRGSQPYVVLTRTRALQVRPSGAAAQLVAIDYGSGRESVVAELPAMPRRLELSPDDRHLAYLAGKGAPAELIMVDLGDGTVSRHALSPAQVGQLLWVQARRVLLAPLSPQQPAVVFDTTLKQRSTMPTWAFAFGTVRRGIAWTLDQQGVLSRANLARGTVRNVADFGSTGVGVVISTG